MAGTALTVLDLLKSSARLFGRLAYNAELTADEAQGGRRTLNDLIDACNIDPLMIVTYGSAIYNLVVNQQNYTIGKDTVNPLNLADFDAPRPAKITFANIITQISGGQPVRTPMELLTDDGWSAIQVQATGSQIPQGLYDDYGADPFSTLKFWPFPNGPAQVEIYSWTALNRYTTLTDRLVLAPGYMKFLRYNLAVDWAPEFGLNVPPVAAAIAAQSRWDIQAHNAPEPVASIDEALLSAKRSNFNYLDGLPN